VEDLEDLGRRCNDTIKMDLHEVRWGSWIGLIWFKIGTDDGALMNVVMNFRVS
jgi:hypothetical protein